MPRFGAFEVDFARAEMRKSGVRVRIQEQSLRILQTLVERRGELVSREELRDRLWPADTFVDFERSLNAAVGKLRQSLNDSAGRPLYIETVARRGYRFIAPVTDSNPEPVPVGPAPAPGPPPAQPSVHPGRLGWLVAGVLAAAVVIVWWAARPEQRADPGRQVVLLDLDVGDDVSQPAISPDGTTLVFVSGGRLAVRKLDQTKIVPIGGTEGASSPFFSPDGKWVAYFARHELRKVLAGGGDSVMLCNAPLDRGGTWAEDGRIIAALSSSGVLSSVNASGGSPRPLTSLEGEPPEVTDHRRPVALPGGKGILFVAGTGVATGLLRVLPPGGAPVKTLVDGSSTGHYVSSGYLLFNRDVTIFAAPMDLDRLELTGPASPLVDEVAHDHFHGADFDVSASGTLVYRRSPPAANRAVTWLDSSGVGSRVLTQTDAYSSPRLSPDGKRLALTSGSKVWIYDLAHEKMTALTVGLADQCCPVWSPDGEYVAFWSRTGLTCTRWDGGGPLERLPLAPGTIPVPFSFSPDGKWLAFHQNSPQTGFDIWVAPVNRTGRVMRLGPPQPLVRQAGLQTAPAISPDGRWLAYGSDAETGRMEVYVIPFTPQVPDREGKWQVSADGGRGPKWSPKGDEMYFRSLDDHLMAARVSKKSNTFQSDKPRLWSTKRLANVGPQINFDVATDGKRILAIFDAEGSEPDETHLRVLLNVDAALRRQRANRGNADSR